MAEFIPLPISNNDYTSRLLFINISVAISALSVLLLRIYTRAYIQHQLDWSDYLMTASMVMSLTTVGFIIAQITYGIGHYPRLVPEQNFTIILHIDYFYSLTMYLGTGLVKISVATFLMKIVTEANHRRYLIMIQVAVGLITIISVFIQIFGCSPIPYYWDSSLDVGSCLPWQVSQSSVILNNVVILLADLALTIGPMLLTWKLHMKLSGRLALAFIFGVGFFAFTASIIKLAYGIFEWEGEYTNMDGVFYNSFEVWAFIELNAGIIAGSLGCLRPLLKRVSKPKSKLSDNDSVWFQDFVKPV